MEVKKYVDVFIAVEFDKVAWPLTHAPLSISWWLHLDGFENMTLEIETPVFQTQTIQCLTLPGRASSVLSILYRLACSI